MNDLERESGGWRVWAVDYFDREAGRSLEAEGVGILAGLELLWRRVLEEGILDDGRPTFTWFELEVWEATSDPELTPRAGDRPLTTGQPRMKVLIPRGALENVELATIRGWREVEGLIPALARAHLECLDSGGAESTLKVAHLRTPPLSP